MYIRLIDEVVEVSEDQAVVAFIKCLEYTHTLTNGKGSIALAGVFLLLVFFSLFPVVSLICYLFILL